VTAAASWSVVGRQRPDHSFDDVSAASVISGQLYEHGLQQLSRL
jgi:hypothetical protein